MSFFFKACFQPNPHSFSLQHTEIQKEQNPHQKLIREQGKMTLVDKKTQRVPNKFCARGGWRRKNEEAEYGSIAYKEQKYQDFIKEKRKNMDEWNLCFEEEFEG